MKSNQLHINVGKSCYMHFKPTLDCVKQTYARIRCFDTNLNNRASDNDCKWSSKTVNLKSNRNFTKIALIFR